MLYLVMRSNYWGTTITAGVRPTKRDTIGFGIYEADSEDNAISQARMKGDGCDFVRDDFQATPLNGCMIDLRIEVKPNY